jgi:hypothetical protein
MSLKLDSMDTKAALAALEERYPNSSKPRQPLTQAQTAIQVELERALMFYPHTALIERFRRGGIYLLLPYDLLLVALAGTGVAQVYAGSGMYFPQSARSIYSSEPYLPLFAGVGLAIVATMIISLILQWQQRKRLAFEIPNSNLATLMADGPEEISRVIDAVPYPWKAFFLRRAGSLRDAVRLLLANVEWFLQPRQRYVSPTWIFWAIAFGLILGSGVVLLSSFSLLNSIYSGSTLSPWLSFLHDNYSLSNGIAALGLQIMILAQGRDLNFRRLAAEHLRNVFLNRD